MSQQQLCEVIHLYFVFILEITMSNLHNLRLPISFHFVMPALNIQPHLMFDPNLKKKTKKKDLTTATDQMDSLQ